MSGPTRIDFRHRRVREIEDITDTVAVILPGNTNQQHAAARIEVQGRDCVTQVLALPEGRQALLGQIPLEMMDWWIDLGTQRLVGNPEHGGEWQAEVF